MDIISVLHSMDLLSVIYSFLTIDERLKYRLLPIQAQIPVINIIPLNVSTCEYRGSTKYILTHQLKNSKELIVILNLNNKRKDYTYTIKINHADKQQLIWFHNIYVPTYLQFREKE